MNKKTVTQLVDEMNSLHCKTDKLINCSDNQSDDGVLEVLKNELG